MVFDDVSVIRKVPSYREHVLKDEGSGMNNVFGCKYRMPEFHLNGDEAKTVLKW